MFNRCDENITDNELKYLGNIWKNFRSLTGIGLVLQEYEAIYLKSDCACRCDKITNEGLKYLGIALKGLKSLKTIDLKLDK